LSIYIYNVHDGLTGRRSLAGRDASLRRRSQLQRRVEQRLVVARRCKLVRLKALLFFCNFENLYLENYRDVVALLGLRHPSVGRMDFWWGKHVSPRWKSANQANLWV